MTYPGGKNGAGTYQKLINLMPPHDVYIEPFLGSGAVMRLKRPARLNIGMDLVPSQLSAVGSALVTSGVPAGSIAVSSERRRSRVLAMALAAPLANPGDGIPYRLFRGCAIDFLEDFLELAAPDLARTAALVYCDPPYLVETLKSSGRYKHMLSAGDHRRLLRVVMGLPCMVMLSGYWSALYADTLQGWNQFQFPAMTRGGLATETVWYNYPLPVELHDYRYLGTGFRERERIKRKKQRWVNRLERMPLLERQALLSVLQPR